MNEYHKQLMKGPSIDTGGCCAICGRYGAEAHHVVFRSQGGSDGPCIPLCGRGNGLYDGSGRMFHHGAAHHHLLHFWWDGRQWSYLITEEPMKLEKALKLDGWKPIEWSGGTEEIEYSDDMPWLHSVRTKPVRYEWDPNWEPPF